MIYLYLLFFLVYSAAAAGSIDRDSDIGDARSLLDLDVTLDKKPQTQNAT